MTPTTVQTFLFDRKIWTAAKARAWLRRNKKIVGRLVEKPNFWHFRQLPPDLFRPRSFRTIQIPGRGGIMATIGHLR
jgi:hypothetical protein